jgi:Virulence factor membrane-bound polymerase, C-terminal/O-Antigen ligase
VLLAAWGVLDNGNSRRTRVGLLLCPVAYGSFWTATSTWAGTADHAIGTAGRFTITGDISSSRFGIWSNALDLIRAHPWFGVGFGEFNLAWTLTEFPNRPIAFFDHTHNLPLQFAVELGLPLSALVLGLLGWSLWRAWRNCLRLPESDGTPSPQRAAFVMLILILVHSMLEYPLWYAYFLLPTAFLFGLCLAKPGGAVSAEAAAPRARCKPYLVRIGAAAMMLGALYSMVDYMRVAAIFAPPANAAPLEERIALGQRSLLFSHHADYAAATTSVDPSIALPAARRAAHYLLDTRLMMAWANALHASGDTERAKYLAQRLVEFRNSVSEPYFAPCKDPSLTDAQRPYQCFAPQRKFTFEDFR